MSTTVAGTTDALLPVTTTTLSVILLVISLIMGLKIWRFRARMDIERSKSKNDLSSSVGVYRSHPFEVASAAPLVRQPNNTTASSSSHKSQLPSSSKQVLPPSSSAQKFKTDSQKNHQASSFQSPKVGQSQPSIQDQKNSEGKKSKTKSTHGKNPLSKPKNPPALAAMGQSQPSDRKGDNMDRNKSKDQSAATKNPLAKLDKHNELLKAKRPPQSMGQNMRPNHEIPVPKSILQKAEQPPRPVTRDDNVSSLKLTDSSSTFLRLPDDNHTPFTLTDDNRASPKGADDNRTSPRQMDDNHTFLRPTHGGSMAFKAKMPLPLYVTEQEASESET
jgi:hypothetical protein